MGETIVIREPMTYNRILEDQQCLPIFQQAGWLDYFMSNKINEVMIKKNSSCCKIMRLQ